MYNQDEIEFEEYDEEDRESSFAISACEPITAGGHTHQPDCPHPDCARAADPDPTLN